MFPKVPQSSLGILRVPQLPPPLGHPPLKNPIKMSCHFSATPRPWRIGCLLSISPAPTVLSANLLMPTLHHVDPQVQKNMPNKHIGLSWFEDFGSATSTKPRKQINKNPTNYLEPVAKSGVQTSTLSDCHLSHLHQKNPFKPELTGVERGILRRFSV